MSSTLTTHTDVYLYILPAIFGFVLAFVFGLGVYQCATLARVKDTYRKRNRVLASRLSHSLAYCRDHDVTTVYDVLREHGYKDLCDLADDGEGMRKGKKHSGIHHKREDASPDTVSESSDGSAKRDVHHSPSGSHRQHSPQRQRDRSRSSSFVLEEVSMMDSDEDFSDDS